MNSEKHRESPTASRENRHALTALGTLAFLVVLAAAVWWSRPAQIEKDRPSAARSEVELAPPPPPRIEPNHGRQIPEIPPEVSATGAEILVDVDKEGNIQIDGRPAEVSNLRSLLSAHRAAAERVGVTIRADEECRFLYVRQVICACDESAGVPYRLVPRPAVGTASS